MSGGHGRVDSGYAAVRRRVLQSPLPREPRVAHRLWAHRRRGGRSVRRRPASAASQHRIPDLLRRAASGPGRGHRGGHVADVAAVRRRRRQPPLVPDRRCRRRAHRWQPAQRHGQRWALRPHAAALAWRQRVSGHAFPARRPKEEPQRPVFWQVHQELPARGGLVRPLGWLLNGLQAGCDAAGSRLQATVSPPLRLRLQAVAEGSLGPQQAPDAGQNRWPGHSSLPTQADAARGGQDRLSGAC